MSLLLTLNKFHTLLWGSHYLLWTSKCQQDCFWFFQHWLWTYFCTNDLSRHNSTTPLPQIRIFLNSFFNLSDHLVSSTAGNPIFQMATLVVATSLTKSFFRILILRWMIYTYCSINSYHKYLVFSWAFHFFTFPLLLSLILLARVVGKYFSRNWNTKASPIYWIQ